MSDKDKQRDILADILNDSHTGNIRGLEELNKLIRLSPNAPPAKAPSAIPATTTPKGRKGQKKQKTTHYLNRKVYDSLGEVKEGVKALLPEEAKSMASKSRIVESAVMMVLQEFGEKGKESALIKELLKKSTDTD